jgi:FKBP-type peptidyl-prolyl cis-trans isomerase
MRFLSFFIPVLILVTVFTSCQDKDSGPTLSLEEQWAVDTTAIGKYLRTNNIPALKDASGVSFVIESVGTGFPPKLTSTVKVSYVGRLLSEVIFDQGTNSTFEMKGLIPGFQIGLALMPEGTKAKIYIPSGYAYGNRALNDIPANANLIFEIELIEVVTSELEKNQLGADTVAIDTYLENNSINAIKDKSGLRYVITEEGLGPKPGLYDKVKLKYTGKLLTNGTVFFSGTNGPSTTFDSRVINYIYAFQAGVTNLPVGSKATFYVPSGLGFGNQAVSNSTVSIPANSNLIFDMEVQEIIE